MKAQERYLTGHCSATGKWLYGTDQQMPLDIWVSDSFVFKHTFKGASRYIYYQGLHQK